LGNERAIGISHMSFGTIHAEQGNGARALEEYDRARLIFEKIGAKSALAVLYGSIADVHAERNKYPEALALYERSLRLRQELGERGVTAQLNNIGMLHLKMGESERAVEYCEQGLAIARELEELNGQYAACQCLYTAYKAKGRFADALAQLEQLNVITDSLKAQETGKKLLQMEFSKVLVADSLLQDQEKRTVAEAHAEEVRQKNRTRNLLLGSSFGILLLAGGVYSRLRLVRRSKAALQVEKDRSEALLLNILPQELADELKAKGEAEAVHIDQVTVLFTDFKGFTAMSEVVTPAQLVRDLNECFSAFDHITGKYGIEKIKTIGDAYMAAGGLPTPNTTHATDVIKAALDMRDFIAEGKARKIAAGLPYFEIRIGIHTGPVVAGIVGVKKFQYDIWGDTVNTASRMESSGEVGQVNISESTYALVKSEGQLSFTPRGKVQAKGKGEMEMYFVS
ncbi:MAG: adenylate/guanylate cyclase domain-containing protein, partial [Flavobacteriales bacterium]